MNFIKLSKDIICAKIKEFIAGYMNNGKELLKKSGQYKMCYNISRQNCKYSF